MLFFVINQKARNVTSFTIELDTVIDIFIELTNDSEQYDTNAFKCNDISLQT